VVEWASIRVVLCGSGLFITFENIFRTKMVNDPPGVNVS
jgi:hypothetical protein